jgi:hypothetical protein
MAFDFPSSPTVGTLYSPAVGPSYIWDGNAWNVVDTPIPVSGVVKISESGPLSGVATIDIVLPSGFKAYDLIINDMYPASVTAISARYSFDGTTFVATASYGWGFDTITTAASAGWAMTGAGGTTASGIQITQTATNTGLINAGSFRFFIPRVDSGVVQGIEWHGFAWTGSTYYQTRGHGRFLSTAGPISAIRFLPGVGVFSMLGGWQLNGIR